MCGALVGRTWRHEPPLGMFDQYRIGKGVDALCCGRVSRTSGCIGPYQSAHRAPAMVDTCDREGHSRSGPHCSRFQCGADIGLTVKTSCSWTESRGENRHRSQTKAESGLACSVAACPRQLFPLPSTQSRSDALKETWRDLAWMQAGLDLGVWTIVLQRWMEALCAKAAKLSRTARRPTRQGTYITAC